MSVTFADDMQGMIKAAVHAAIDTEVRKAKEAAHEHLEKALNEALAKVAVTLAQRVDIRSRENEIVISVRKS